MFSSCAFLWSIRGPWMSCELPLFLFSLPIPLNLPHSFHSEPFRLSTQWIHINVHLLHLSPYCSVLFNPSLIQSLLGNSTPQNLAYGDVEVLLMLKHPCWHLIVKKWWQCKLFSGCQVVRLSRSPNNCGIGLVPHLVTASLITQLQPPWPGEWGGTLPPMPWKLRRC